MREKLFREPAGVVPFTGLEGMEIGNNDLRLAKLFHKVAWNDIALPHTVDELVFFEAVLGPFRLKGQAPLLSFLLGRSYRDKIGADPP